jgi:hypothetical protein
MVVRRVLLVSYRTAMKKRVVASILLFAAGIAMGSMAVEGHHSLAGIYDSSKQVTVEGVVTQFQFVNPHPFLLIEVTNAAGTAQQWRLEMDNRFELIDIGMSGETLKRGDKVIVKGSPAYSQQQSLYLRRLDRPADGFWYEQVGSTPRTSIRSRD